METSRREAIESASVQAEVGVQLDSLLAENAQLLRAKTELEQQNEALGQAYALGDTDTSWESEGSESEAQERLVNSTTERRKKWLQRVREAGFDQALSEYREMTSPKGMPLQMRRESC